MGHQGDRRQARIPPGQDADQIGQFDTVRRTALALEPLRRLGRQGSGLGRGLQAEFGHPLQEHGPDPRMIGRADGMRALGDLADVDHGAFGREGCGGGPGPDGRGDLQGQHRDQQRQSQ